MRAPKIIVYEGLLGEELLTEGQANTIMIDLGQIELHNKLIKFEKDVDYT